MSEGPLDAAGSAGASDAGEERAGALDPDSMRPFKSKMAFKEAARGMVPAATRAGGVYEWARKFESPLGEAAYSIMGQAGGSARRYVELALRETLRRCEDGEVAAMVYMGWLMSRRDGDEPSPMVMALASVGAFPRGVGSDGNSALHCLAANGLAPELAAALAAMGPRVGRAELSRRNVDGRTPAQSAMAHGAVDCVMEMDKAWDSFPVNHERAADSSWIHERALPKLGGMLALVEREIVKAQSRPEPAAAQASEPKRRRL